MTDLATKQRGGKDPKFASPKAPPENLSKLEFDDDPKITGDEDDDTPEVKTQEVKTQEKPKAKKQEDELPPIDEWDEDDRPFVNKMSKEASTHFRGKLKSLKEASDTLKKQLEEASKNPKETFYNHPKGYMLTPEYQETSSKLEKAIYEVEFYKQQLNRVRNGQPWQAIHGYDDDGNPKFSPTYKATEQAADTLLTEINRITMSGQSIQQELEKLEKSHSDAVKQNNDTLLNERKKRFAWRQDEKLLDSDLEIEGYGKAKINKVISDFKQLFPAAYRDHPVTDVAADLFIALQMALGQSKTLEGKAKTEENLRKELLTTEPPINGEGLKTGKGASKVVEFDDDGMPT